MWHPIPSPLQVESIFFFTSTPFFALSFAPSFFLLLLPRNTFVLSFFHLPSNLARSCLDEIKNKRNPCHSPRPTLARFVRLFSFRSSHHYKGRMFTKAISVAAPIFLALLITNFSLVAAFPKISAVGNKFFTDEGKQFYIKGTKS